MIPPAPSDPVRGRSRVKQIERDGKRVLVDEHGTIVAEQGPTGLWVQREYTTIVLAPSTARQTFVAMVNRRRRKRG